MEHQNERDENVVLSDDNSVPSDSETMPGDEGGAPRRCSPVIIFGLVVAVLLAAAATACGLGKCKATKSSQSTSSDEGTLNPPMLVQVRERGRLRCGVAKDIFQPSISQGFNAGLCRAIAAASLGADGQNRVDFVEVSPMNRFPTLQRGAVDVLVAHTTHTMERDLNEPTTAKGFSFSIPYLYTGLAFAGEPFFVDCADKLDSSGNCTGIRICAVGGTTHESLLRGLYPAGNLIILNDIATVVSNFRQQLCQVIAGEQFTIAPAVIEGFQVEGNFKLGQNVFSKEPLALVTRDDDSQWSDFVNWVLHGLIYAQEIGVNQRAAQLLGRTEVFGPELSNMFVDAIAAGGNYGELYDRYLDAIIPQDFGANTINTGDSGLIFSMPFGSVTRMGPSASGTLAKIRARGELWCGISKRPIFAVEDPGTGALTGQDVDFCRALSAAIFDGDPNKVRFTDLSAAERFRALNDGDVDVLSRVTTATLTRDVNETTTMAGFSFSQINFYDGLSFGGRPPYGMCADNLDITSESCIGLKICVNNGTTFLSRMQELFPSESIVVQERSSLVFQGLREGDCNTIAGGIGDVSLSSVVGSGEFSGDYEIGTKLFTKDPLALVTRQDDKQWSSFVYWVVSAIFFAEEEEIGQLRSFDMPLVNLFGPAYSRMFRNAVGAVGHFGEIYDRNVASEVPRSELNQLNENPLGPQHYSYPGI